MEAKKNYVRIVVDVSVSLSQKCIYILCRSIQQMNKPVPMQIAGEAAAVGDASVDPR